MIKNKIKIKHRTNNNTFKKIRQTKQHKAFIKIKTQIERLIKNSIKQ